MHCSQLRIQRIPLALTHLYGEREGKDTVQHGLADKDQIITYFTPIGLLAN
jgi:hypothetical protein